LDAGVNFIDTAAGYGTEEIVGQAVRGLRDKVIISTKQTIVRPDTSEAGQVFLSGDEYRQTIEGDLTRLGTDYIDILQLHAVTTDQYSYCQDELVPALLKLRDQGKIRFIGITERFAQDTSHSMMVRALDDDVWDVAMIGFNLINQSARHLLLTKTAKNNVGTLGMFAVRRALSNAEACSEVIADLRKNGQVDLGEDEAQDVLGFLTDSGVAGSVIEAAYRFCRHEPGMHIVLTGTGSEAHLHENIAAIQMPPLPDAVHQRLMDIFGRVDSVSGN